MIGTGLTEEQVLNSFIDREPNPKSTQFIEPEATYERGLFVNMLDIWSSDDEETQEGIDVWGGEREWVVEPVASTEEKKEEKKEEPVIKEEPKVELRTEEKEEQKKELSKKTMFSI